jgi:hypothetical protein
LRFARQECNWCQLRLAIVQGIRFLADHGLDEDTCNSLCNGLDCPGVDAAALVKATPRGRTDWTTEPEPLPTGHAAVLHARLHLARSYLALQDAELKTERFMGLQYRKLSLTYEQVKACRAQREAFATQVKTCCQQYRAGRGTLDLMLEAQRFWADGLAQEYAAIVAHSNTQCGFAFGKGSIRQRATTEDGGVTTAPTLVTLWKSVIPLEDVQPLPLLETPSMETPPVEKPRGAKDAPLKPWKVEDLFPGGAADSRQGPVPRRLP